LSGRPLYHRGGENAGISERIIHVWEDRPAAFGEDLLRVHLCGDLGMVTI